MRGPDVRTLQRDLTALGLTTTANGVFNRVTRSHVLAFQRRYQLAADGVVGALTIAKLEAVVASKRSLGATASSSGTAKTGAASLVSATPSTPSSQKPKTPSTPTPMPTSTTSTTPTPTTPTTTTPPAATGTTTGAGGIGTEPSNAPIEPVTLNADGLAVPPADAPAAIVELIAAANRISHLPYIYGGGHAVYHGNPVALDAGYDCSGSVSFALHGAGMLSEPLDSTEFESWGMQGAGRWITMYTNDGHVYMKVGGLWFDTGAQSYANGEDRWSTTRMSPSAGFMVVHPRGW